MRPFKFFFGISLSVMLFFVVAKFVILAVIAAAIMSAIFGIFRRLAWRMRYDRYDDDYDPAYHRHYAPEAPRTEPLFYGSRPRRYPSYTDLRFIDVD